MCHNENIEISVLIPDTAAVMNHDKMKKTKFHPTLQKLTFCKTKHSRKQIESL